MKILKNRKIFYTISLILIVLSFVSLGTKGLNLGVDFTGDAQFEIAFLGEQPSTDDVANRLTDAGVSVVSVTEQSDRDIEIRTSALGEAELDTMRSALSEFGQFQEKGFVSIGPTIGKELRQNALRAIGLSLLVIVIFIAWAFRSVSKPIPSWMYGIIAIVALVHDVIIPTGLFSLLQLQIDSFFITALLTVIGFSVHDSIVVFDRVRENLKKHPNKKFEEVVGMSLSETITRSINTSLTTVFALVAIYFFGGEEIRSLSLALTVGVLIGTYSSIFLATPLLVTVAKFKKVK